MARMQAYHASDVRSLRLLTLNTASTGSLSCYESDVNPGTIPALQGLVQH